MSYLVTGDNPRRGTGASGRKRQVSTGRGRSGEGNCRSVRKIVPLPGAVYSQWTRCGRPNCHCVAGGHARHGPYLYRRWLEDGHRRSQYVRAADVERVRAGLAEWKRLHPPARSTRTVLAELQRLMRDLEG